MSNIASGKVPFIKAQSWMSVPDVSKEKIRTSKHPRVRIGSAHHEWNHIVVPLIALWKGFWAEEGMYDVEIVTLESEASSLENLGHGREDFAVDPATALLLKAIHEGNDIYIIAPRRATHSFYLFGQKGMKSVKDLKGGRINAFTPGDEMTAQSAQVIRDAGMVPDKDVKITLFEGEMHDIFGMEKAFRKGESQGLLATDLQVEKLKADGYPLLVNLQEAYLPRQDRVVVATGNMVNNYPGTVKAFLKGFIRSNRFFLDRKNKEEITSIVEAAGFVIENRKLYDTIFESLYTRIPYDCNLPVESIVQVIKEQIAAGQIDSSMTTDRVVRIKPLQEAQKELGIK